MKGLRALEAEIMSARRRLTKMRDAGRLGDTAIAMQYADALDGELSGAQMYINVLRKYEVGREDNIPQDEGQQQALREVHQVHEVPSVGEEAP